MRFHSDDRRTGYFDVFANPDGDINVVYLEPHIPIGWHRHQKQVDRLFLISGVLHLKIFEQDYRYDGVEHLLTTAPGERYVYCVPENMWHGYMALAENTVILQFNGPGKYSGEDEERCPISEGFPWTW